MIKRSIVLALLIGTLISVGDLTQIARSQTGDSKTLGKTLWQFDTKG